jgi:hypothetical protein
MSDYHTEIDWRQPINWMHPLNRGLVGKWLVLPGMGGSRWRDLTRINDGTLTNMDPTDWVGATSRPGGWGAVAFDATDDYVNTHSDFDSAFSNVTAATWVNHTSLTGGQAYIGHRSTPNNGWVFKWNGSVLQITLFGVVDKPASSSGLIANQWQHTAVTYDGGTVVFFENGKEVSSHSVGTMRHATEDMYLGSLNNKGTAADFFNGMLDDPTLYDRALSATDVSDLFHESKNGYPNALNRIGRPRRFVAATAGVPKTPYFAWQAAMT